MTLTMEYDYQVGADSDYCYTWFMDMLASVTVDRTAIEVSSLFDEDGEMAYWLKQSPYERLRAVELMRRILYGYHQPAPRLQRVFEVAQRSQR